jgi:hypothetical protein
MKITPLSYGTHNSIIPKGDINLKNKIKYVSKNIGCNILVVG